MAGVRYGTTQYGTAFYGGDVGDEFSTAFFSAQANGYGRAFVRWSRPGGAWTQQRLVRNLVGLPVDENDGDLLLDEPARTASRELQDEGLTEGRHYYYGLFVRDLATEDWLRVGTAQLMATRDHGYTRRLYDRVPRVFRVTDDLDLTSEPEDEEATQLYRFLSLFGLQLDHVRSELEALRQITNPRQVSSKLLPALAQSVGVTYEPELGDRAVRRLAANAMHLYAVKGTLAGARSLATVFTGWDAVVRLGHNIALDRLDAGPDGGVGRWTGRTNASTSYRAFTDDDRGPAGEGALVVTARAAGLWMAVDSNPAGTAAPLERLQYAVPIIPGLRYVASQYVRSEVAGLTARVGMTWLDAQGQPLDDVAYGPAEPVGPHWLARPASTTLAPVGARYLEHQLRIDGPLAAADEVLACGLQVQESATVSPWAPAREVVVHLRGDLENHVGNTSGHGLSAEGWTDASATAVDEQPYLTFSDNLTRSPNAYSVVRKRVRPSTYQQRLVVFPTYLSATRLQVDPSDYISTYSAGMRLVSTSEVWSVLVDVVGVGNYERDMQVGFACYDGDELVRYQWGPVVRVGQDEQTLVHELTVPDNADFDRVAFAVRASDLAVRWRNAALERAKLADARQFDGSTPSQTLDYLWEGVPYRSTSHYYSRRVVRTLRLRELLHEFLPHPASFRLVFATAAIPDSPRASAGSDLDPDDSPFTVVGTRVRSRWRVATPVGTGTEMQWRVESRQVGAEVTARWNLDQLNKQLTATWGTRVLVAADLDTRWRARSNVPSHLDARWNTRVLAQPTDVEVLWGSRQNTAGDLDVRWNVSGPRGTYANTQRRTDPDTYAARTSRFATYDST